MNVRKNRPNRLSTAALRALLWVLLIAILECVVCNLPFWTSTSASTDSAAALNAIGAGLERQNDGTLIVHDPQQAWIEADSDGSSPYVRVDMNIDKTADSPHTRLSKSFFVAPQVDGHMGRSISLSQDAPRSHYLNVGRGSTVKLWIQEAAGTRVAATDLRTNVRVPFSIEPVRIALMAVIAVFVEAFRPGSPLWRISLDTGSRKQRGLFWGMFALLGAATLADIIPNAVSPESMAFHQPGNYTYDFNQYGHLADALLHGQVSLDMPVPSELLHASNPYDPSVREQLLHDGVTPIYWDYVFYQGHWYSYFGVLPALLLFAPFRLISSWFTPGGLMLSTHAAVGIMTFGIILFAALLMIRVTKRVAPNAPLAGMILALLTLLVGSNVSYLALRTNFYSVPCAASLLLSIVGLWFWFGAINCEEKRNKHTVRIGSAPPVSWPHLAAGSLAMAGTIGCRPTFIFTALLALPLFWRQLQAIAKTLLSKRFRPTDGSTARAERRNAITLLCAALLPALAIIISVGIYNAARFGSPLNFGEQYQLTVSDMMTVTGNARNLMSEIGYYLATPLTFMDRFPFLGITATPMTNWSYTDPMAGGLFMLCPALLLVVALPWMRRRLRTSGIFPTLVAAVALAALLIVVDSAKGGLSWRYMIDFGWLLALVAAVVLVTVTASMHADTSGELRVLTADETHASASAMSWHSTPVRLAAIRLLCVVLVSASLLISVLTAFTPGRDDALIKHDPVLFHTVQSWFSLLFSL